VCADAATHAGRVAAERRIETRRLQGVDLDTPAMRATRSAWTAHCAGCSIGMGLAMRELLDQQGDRPSAGLSDMQAMSPFMLVE
jgi:hypothetical protein